MPRDYRRGAVSRPAPKRRQNSRSCVWWFLLGTALGVVVGSLYATRHAKTADTPPSPPTPAADERPAPTPPSFKFEEILKDAEVDLDDKAPPPPPPAPRPQPPAARQQPPAAPPAELPATPTPPTATPRSGTYVVQVASVRRAADAERLKAELALMGIVATVQPATLSNGQTTYRVRTGPYASRQAADQVRNQLKRKGKDGMTIPIR